MKEDFWNTLLKVMNKNIENIQNSSNYFPVGACAVIDSILHFSVNTSHKHAEQILLEDYNLKNSIIIITLEPCPSCLWSLLEAQVKYIFFGAFNAQYGLCGGRQHILNNIEHSYKTKIFGGILEKENQYILNKFFSKLRLKQLKYKN
jgi:tRNA(Arg) A34 adenosine deaminase TadA